MGRCPGCGGWSPPGRWRGEQRLRDWRGGDPIPVVSSTFVIAHPRTDEPWLVATVQRDISERLAAERALGRLADERQQLLGRLVQAENTERSRIAADVHDDSVQALAAVDLRLGLLRRRLETTAPEALPDVDALRETVGGATERLRNLLFDLESAAESVDLVTALSEAAAFLLGDAVSWRVEHDEGVDLPVASRVTAYRAAKEAMANALKHAGASEVVIEARYLDDGVAVCIADDGRGLAADATLRRPGHRGSPTTATAPRSPAVGCDWRSDPVAAPWSGCGFRPRTPSETLGRRPTASSTFALLGA